MERIWAPWREEYVTGAGKKDAKRGGCVLCRTLKDARHVGSLAAATAEELSEIMALTRRLEDILGKAYKPDGMNLGMNLGKSAGAGVADHIHLHVLPRWTGDTNFMTVVGETRVIPEDPAKACAKLRSLFER